MHLDEIDGELHILDENLDVVHVWTRANGEVTLSRAAHKHYCFHRFYRVWVRKYRKSNNLQYFVAKRRNVLVSAALTWNEDL